MSESQQQSGSVPSPYQHGFVRWMGDHYEECAVYTRSGERLLRWPVDAREMVTNHPEQFSWTPFPAEAAAEPAAADAPAPAEAVSRPPVLAPPMPPVRRPKR